MSKTDYNLEEAMNLFTKGYAHKLSEMEDAGVYAYIKGASEILAFKGEDITKYALIRVQNPMQYKENGVTVSAQWRIVPIGELSNLPVYED